MLKIKLLIVKERFEVILNTDEKSFKRKGRIGLAHLKMYATFLETLELKGQRILHSGRKNKLYSRGEVRLASVFYNISCNVYKVLREGSVAWNT